MENCIEPPQQDVADKGNRNQKHAKLLGGKNGNELVQSFQSWFGAFSKRISPKRYIGFKISEITESVLLFQYSEILFNEFHLLMISIC